MPCRLCTEKLSIANASKIRGACASCHKQYVQMMAGFKGVRPEPKDDTVRWDNSAAYAEWENSLTDTDLHVALSNKGTYTEQRCDVRDMRGEVGLPKFAPLESQVYVAWIEDGVKDTKIQEVLGLTYTQLSRIKAIVRMKLKKQMAFYLSVKKLEADAKEIKKRKG